jgi:hypothetical protein
MDAHERHVHDRDREARGMRAWLTPRTSGFRSSAISDATRKRKMT